VAVLGSEVRQLDNIGREAPPTDAKVSDREDTVAAPEGPRHPLEPKATGSIAAIKVVSVQSPASQTDGAHFA